MGSVVLVVVGLVAGAWFTSRLRGVPKGGGAPRSSVSVIVPARNEERNLACLLDSLHPLPAGVEVIVVDDGSTDATATVARSRRARLVTAPPPPDGWLGKPWACWLGAGAARGETLVFLDADTELGPGAVGALCAAHRDQVPAGLLSVQPFHRTERPYEQASAGPNIVSMIASGSFSPVPSRSNRAVAFGPCLVTSAAAYAAVGGHRAVAGEVIEDLHLARAFRDAGRPVRCLTGGSVIRFRMYPDGVGQLVEGWSKNLSGGARLAPVGPTLAGVLWVTAGLSVAVAMAGSLAGWASGEPFAWWPAVAWVGYGGHVRWVLRRIGTFRWWTGWLFPLPLAAFVALFLWSAIQRVGRRRVAWRGRTIAWGRAGG